MMGRRDGERDDCYKRKLKNKRKKLFFEQKSLLLRKRKE